MSRDNFPRTSLLFGPSPIHPLPRLSAALGGQVEIWAKREDCNSGIAVGGNEVRKLEYLAADALAKVDWPDAAYDKVGNIQLTRIMGGDVPWIPPGFDIGIRDSWKRALESVEAAGGGSVSARRFGSRPVATRSTSTSLWTAM